MRNYAQSFTGTHKRCGLVHSNFKYKMTILTIGLIGYSSVLFPNSLIKHQSNHYLTSCAAHVKEPVTQRACQQSQNDESCRYSQTITVQFGAQLHANYLSAPARMQRVMGSD